MRVAIDAEAVPEGLQEDLQIEGETPTLDVVEVVLDPLLDRRVAAPAVDLGPAGDPRLHLVAEHVAWHAAPELLDEARALRPRPHEAHLAVQHVEELRQLVEARPPQGNAERGTPRIILARPHRSRLRLGVHPHRPELQHPEAPAVDPHALLAIEDGPRRGELERDRDPQHHWRRDRQRERAEDQVEHALDDAVPAVELGLAQVDERDHLELFDPAAVRDETEHVRHHVDAVRLVAVPAYTRLYYIASTIRQ